MQLREIMTTDVKLTDSATTLKDAAALMRDGDFGLLPVGENDRLVGTITDRDITARAVADGRDPPPRSCARRCRRGSTTVLRTRRSRRRPR